MQTKSKLIPYGSHYVDKQDLKYIKDALFSGLLTSGKYQNILSEKLKKYLKCDYVTLSNSGTSALHLSFLGINLKKNDIVIMPSINFIASYNMASKIGAKIYLADVDKDTGQMTHTNILDCIKKNKLKKIKCIITMYLGGSPENAEKIYKLKNKFNCFIIEDSCHAFGSYYYFKKKKYMVGSNIHSDISTFSFHPVKSIASGEGGCITTNSKKIFSKMNELKNHGIKKNLDKHWDYNIVSNGFNYRISDINCALATSQLNKINKFTLSRNKIAKFYLKKLKNLDNYLSFPKYSKNTYSCYHLMVVKIFFNKLKKNKDDFLAFMLKNNIFCQYHYKPIYNFKIYRQKINKANFKGAENFYKNSLSLPIYYKLKNQKLNYINSKIIEFINKYKKK